MPITQDLKREAWSQASDLPVVLLQLDHVDLLDPIRVVNDKKDLTSNGETYIAFPFEISLPDDSEDSPPRARLVIDNVSREIGQTIRQIQSPVSVTISVVRRSAPNVIEVSFPAMKLFNVQYDSLTVEGNLELENLTREGFPVHLYSPGEFPGLIA